MAEPPSDVEVRQRPTVSRRAVVRTLGIATTGGDGCARTSGPSSAGWRAAVLRADSRLFRASAFVVRPPMLVTLASIALAHALMNARTYSGDPTIHLIFAKNLLAGFPLQFNPGIYSSGETSPIYMCLLAAILAVGDVVSAALFAKVFGVTCACALLWLCFRYADERLAERGQALALSLALGALPLFFFQAQLGMENMSFALVTALLVRKLRQESQTTASWTLLGGAAHTAFYLRPEAVFIVLFTYVLLLRSPRRWRHALALQVLLTVLLAASVLALEWSMGVPLHGAGALRAMASRADSIPVLGTSLRLSHRPLAFIAYAWPLLTVAVCGLRRLEAGAVALLGCLVLAPLSLHILNVFPNTQFSRYALYWWFPTFAVAIDAVGCAPRAARLSIAAFVLNCLLVGGVEVVLRSRGNSFANHELDSFLAKASMDSTSRFSDGLCRHVDCSHPPISVALQEVQLRLFLDERFVVRSLDGIVDSDLRNYVAEDGIIDHLGYLRDKDVSLILEFPDYSRTGRSRSLARVFAQTANGPVTVDCARFERRPLPDWIYPEVMVRTALPGCR